MHCLQNTSTFLKDLTQIFLQVSILYMGYVFPDIQRKVSNYLAHQVCLWCSLHPPAPESNFVSQVKWAGAAAQHSALEKHRGGADQLWGKTLRPDRAKALTEEQATFHSFPLFMSVSQKLQETYGIYWFCSWGTFRKLNRTSGNVISSLDSLSFRENRALRKKSRETNPWQKS